jgi:hypothetical protein
MKEMEKILNVDDLKSSKIELDSLLLQQIDVIYMGRLISNRLMRSFYHVKPSLKFELFDLKSSIEILQLEAA